jgi:integrase/recombinase XerD
MLSVYTRHAEDCKHYRDKLWRRCNCPKWIWGSHNGEFVRMSAKTRFWDDAERLRHQMEFPETVKPEPEILPPTTPLPSAALIQAPVTSITVIQASPAAMVPAKRVTIHDAVKAYLADAVSRELAEDTLSKLERIFRKQFLTWCQIAGLEYLDQVNLDALINFRNTWKDGRLAKQKKQSRVIGFFWECVRRDYIIKNPALALSRIKVVHVPTDYFPRDEFDRIIDATYAYGDPRGGYIPVEDTRTRLRTLTLLMRWSGLRIRDAVTLERHRLHGESLLLYQAKTGTPVYVPLPPFVIEALQALPPGPKPNATYFFWSGNGNPKSAVADWQRSYRRLFELANITRPDGSLKRSHPHMFRDTFAVEMLLAGVPIDQVSLLLGHASVKVTEKSYSPFVKARQIQLQDSVRNAWSIGTEPSPEPPKVPSLASPQSSSEAQVSVHRSSGWEVIRSAKPLMEPSARSRIKR